MKDLFIADAHLLEPEDANYRDLLAFLGAQADQIRNLVILGDLFEFWIGSDRTVPGRYRPLLTLLEELHRRGVRLTYVEGNHDFHLGPFFRDRLECRILPDGGSIELDGLRIHLAHGDLVDPTDTGYRLWRALVRSRAVRLLAGLAPQHLTWNIARALSRRSRKRRAGKPEFDPTELLKGYARRQLAAGHDLVVTGHYHHPMQIDFEQGRLVALGDWIGGRSYAVLEDGELKLLDWRDSA
ncbi:MAG: UDP-2,3-diacylglucosamine diphosphatase [Deltaproteobacteria bacterium]|nr:MAG: UDP-2,3-diacylglucosamine diphosphatase [Deltaproteobacteria bacterium]